MADEEKSPAQAQQDLFELALAPPPEAPAEQETQQVTEPPPAPAAAPPPTPEAPPSEAAIPSWRLREEAEARRLAEDRARALEERLNQVAAHLQQQQKQPDFFENPDAATQAAVMRVLQPFAEAQQRQVEEQRQREMYFGRAVARLEHGADTVDKAEQAFLAAREHQSLDPADYERVVQSPNRYDAVVQWHRKQTAYSTVGDDPEAWYKKRLEADLADPKFQAELMERARKGAAGRPAATSLPPSLSRTTSAADSGGEPIGDMSDASLFAYAMKPQRRR
jgi:hypothetical protein